MKFERDGKVSDIQTRSAQVRAGSANEDELTIETVLATDRPVRMFDYRNWEVIDEVLPAEARLESDHMPLLDSHSRHTVSNNLGHLENVRSEGGDTICRMHFDSEDELAQKTFKKYKNGHLRSVSVGYEVTRYETIGKGETRSVAGKDYTAGEDRKLRIATQWRVDEGSAVNIPADDKANVRGVRSSQVSETEAAELLKQRKNQPESERTDSTKEPTAESGSQRKESAVPDTAPKTTVDDQTRQNTVDEAQVREAAQKAERKRVADLYEIAGDDVAVETVRKAIEDGTSAEDFRSIALKELRKSREDASPGAAGSDAPNIQTGDRHARDCTQETLGLAIAMRLSQGKNIEDLYGRMSVADGSGKVEYHERALASRIKNRDNVLEQANQYRRLPLVDICREALRMSQQDIPLDRGDMIQRAMSTPALTTIFTNAIGAELLGNFESVPDSTQGWCREGDTLDFHSKDRHKVDGGRMTKHRRGGEAEHAEAVDRKESNRAHRYSKQLKIDEMDIADDALNAIQDRALEYGLATGSLRPDLVYAVLLANPTLSDSIALFHADHGNLSTSGGSLSGLCTSIANQTNAKGLNMALQARYVITSPTKGDDAYRLISSRETRGTGETLGTNNPAQRRNLIALEEPRLDTGFVDPDTGAAVAAASNSFFVASNMVAYTLEVLYGLTGRMPLVRSEPLKNGSWGMSWDVKYDMGVAALDHRGLAKSTAAIAQ